MFDAAGYHVRGDKVYYLSAFPGKASEIAGADVASFKAFDTTYAKDKSNAYFDGHPIPGADATSFDVLDRSGFARDRNHVYQLRSADQRRPRPFRAPRRGARLSGFGWQTSGYMINRRWSSRRHRL